jgi:hypothetical protein
MAKPRSNIEHALMLKEQGIRTVKNFPINHTAMRVPETPAMAALRVQIEGLQAQHTALHEAEQLRFWKTFLYIAKEGPVGG